MAFNVCEWQKDQNSLTRHSLNLGITMTAGYQETGTQKISKSKLKTEY